MPAWRTRVTPTSCHWCCALSSRTSSSMSSVGTGRRSMGLPLRDYVHVEDVADAHVAMAEALSAGAVHDGAFNIGRGEGVSVLQMLDAVEKVAGKPVRRRIVERRPGIRHASSPTRPLSGRRSVGARAGASTRSSKAPGRRSVTPIAFMSDSMPPTTGSGKRVAIV